MELDFALLSIAAFDQSTVEVYDPWADRWAPAKSSGSKILLPEFQRSLVVRIRHDAAAATD
ncbi:MAG: hypothetical protein HUU20_10215 [Pirellulales bacterium]|nr:hypothetical protein [Pirellulales bacterium]